MQHMKIYNYIRFAENVLNSSVFLLKYEITSMQKFHREFNYIIELLRSFMIDSRKKHAPQDATRFFFRMKLL